MKVKVLVEESEALGTDYLLVRWDAELEKEDLKLGMNIDQVKEELNLGLNKQLHSKKIW